MIRKTLKYISIVAVLLSVITTLFILHWQPKSRYVMIEIILCWMTLLFMVGKEVIASVHF
jgi:hypothetical protein